MRNEVGATRREQWFGCVYSFLQSQGAVLVKKLITPPFGPIRHPVSGAGTVVNANWLENFSRKLSNYDCGGSGFKRPERVTGGILYNWH